MIALPGRYAFVDVETTGTDPARNRVIEVAIVTLDDGEVVEEWSSLVDPECPIPPTITGMTGIDDTMVAGAPAFSRLADEVLERLESRVFVAHNARFDYGFLRNELHRAGATLRARQLCTVRLSRALYPGCRGHGLDALIARFGLSCDGRHRALGDVRATIDFVHAALADRGAEAVEAAVAQQLEGPALPPGLPAGALDDLPAGPGVYLFYGDGDALLYVGKSTGLHGRVRSHFAGDHRTQKAARLAQTVTRVDWIETAGELGALLREAELIKQRQPLHNRRLRRSGTQVLLALAEDAEGYLGARTVSARALPEMPEAAWFGPWSGERAARRRLRQVAEEQGLCPRRLGLERPGHGPCFARQLGRCRGACDGGESPARFNLRLLEALGPERVPHWPWSGPAVVREDAAVADRSEWHLFDRWCYLGSTGDPCELAELAQRPRVFDRDHYRTLLRWLQRRPDSARPLEERAPGRGRRAASRLS
ncbi:MAG: exonuclease domain-containing protein [Halofilum sp. (in: g-proteobacteria)]|nr:exonuclease domain-containing protein [Halofilum sp. (in: g-proteobacteria)]